VGPAQLSYQRCDNLLVRENLRKLDHAAKILLAEAGAMLFHQLSSQRYDNLAALGSAFFAKHFLGDAFSDAPADNVNPALTVAATGYATKADKGDDPETADRTGAPSSGKSFIV
jgi:hypothetical protein